MSLNIVPLPGQTLLQTRDQISGNFTVINTAFEVNHVAYNDANQGKHKWVTFPRQAATPVPPFVGTEMSLYTLLNATSGTSELYVQKGVGAGIPFTLSANGGVSGWTYIPSGMKMVWGQGTILAGSSTATVLFSSVAGFPGFSTSALGIQLTRIHNATSANFTTLESFTNTQFVARRSTSNTGGLNNFTWFAIGR